MNIGPFELLVIVAVLLLVVGPTVLPKITRNLGKSVGSFKKGMRDHDEREEDGPVEGKLERTEPPVRSIPPELPAGDEGPKEEG